MTGQFIGFAFWGFIGCIFIYLGIRSFFLKEPMVFWANAQMFEVNDVKKYNYAENLERIEKLKGRINLCFFCP